jgi:uncharacterized protein YlxP (DUF503 family)
MKLIISVTGDIEKPGYECVNIIKNQSKLDEYPNNSVDEVLFGSDGITLNNLTEERALEVLQKVCTKCRKKCSISMSIIDGYEVASLLHNRIVSVQDFNKELTKIKSLLDLTKIFEIFNAHDIMILCMKKEGMFVNIAATRV